MVDKKEAALPRLLLLCPVTGNSLDTGVSLDPRAFAAYRPRNGRSFCPHCHHEHRWTKERMHLSDDEPGEKATPVGLR